MLQELDCFELRTSRCAPLGWFAWGGGMCAPGTMHPMQGFVTSPPQLLRSFLHCLGIQMFVWWCQNTLGSSPGTQHWFPMFTDPSLLVIGKKNIVFTSI